MKTFIRILCFVGLLLLNTVIQAQQIVHIPDPAFKQALLDHEPIIDTNFDGEIQVSEAEAVVGLLDVNGQFIDIYDSTGIEAFINITGLEIWQNKLTELDLSQNTKLKYLNCWDNPLTTLNIIHCEALENLDISKTYLTEIDLRPFENLEIVSLGVSDNLTYVDLRNGNNTNIGSFTCLRVPNLTCIYVDDSEFSEGASGWYKDPEVTYVETQEECDALGFNDLFFRNVHIFPNPAQNVLNIELPDLYFEELYLAIKDVAGKTIAIHQLKTDFTLDVSQLPSGIYFLNIYNNQNKRLTKKLVKL